MELHLFSTPGERDIRYITDTCRPYLEGKPDPTVAYLPLASLSNAWLDYTEKSFRGLAHIETIDAETMELPEMESILRQAHVAYIPGGNTFLLNHRLHVSKLMPYLRKKIQSGLPVVAFSAGTILCGQNILTSRDMNTVEAAYFDGLKLTPFNFHVHYFDDPDKDEWLMDYHVFHDNPVILMADGAYIKVNGKKTCLVRGEAWILRKNREKEVLAPGVAITL